MLNDKNNFKQFCEDVKQHKKIKKQSITFANAIFEDFMIDNSYSCRKGKGTLYAAKDIQRQLSEITNRYKENAYILKLDLKGFFINIDKEITYNIIEKII